MRWHTNLASLSLAHKPSLDNAYVPSSALTHHTCTQAHKHTCTHAHMHTKRPTHHTCTQPPSLTHAGAKDSAHCCLHALLPRPLLGWYGLP